MNDDFKEELKDCYADLQKLNERNAEYIGTIDRLRRRVAETDVEIERLRAHLKTAIWSDSEECKLLTRINAALLEAPTVDVAVVVPDRDYSAMTPKDCYEAGLLDGVHQAREAIKAATRAALAQEKPND